MPALAVAAVRTIGRRLRAPVLQLLFVHRSHTRRSLLLLLLFLPSLILGIIVAVDACFTMLLIIFVALTLALNLAHDDTLYSLQPIAGLSKVYEYKHKCKSHHVERISKLRKANVRV